MSSVVSSGWKGPAPPPGNSQNFLRRTGSRPRPGLRGERHCRNPLAVETRLHHLGIQNENSTTMSEIMPLFKIQNRDFFSWSQKGASRASGRSKHQQKVGARGGQGVPWLQGCQWGWLGLSHKAVGHVAEVMTPMGQGW